MEARREDNLCPGGKTVGDVAATSAIEVVHGLAGETIDATRSISKFVSTGPLRSPEGRITISRPLPARRFGNPEIQPLAGTRDDQGNL